MAAGRAGPACDARDYGGRREDGEGGVGGVPFNVAGSRLLRLVKREEEPHMPGTGPALSAEAVGAALAGRGAVCGEQRVRA